MQKSDKSIYVVDTNVLIDYPNIIPNGENIELDQPTVDTSDSHLVIPTAVIRELSRFKKESSDRGLAARQILRRLRKITESASLPADIEDCYKLQHPISIKYHDSIISLLPVHKDFTAQLPFCPSNEDMDGQIILATLSANQYSKKTATLLTNDNGLALRAFPRGIKTSRYGYNRPEPYTGRRDLSVPFDLFHIWSKDHEIPLEVWLRFMPDIPPLIANEFIIMQIPDDWYENIKRFSNIGRYDAAKQSIVPLDYLGNFPESLSNDGQAIYAEALCHPDIDALIVTGPAGTGKTYMATVYALEANRRKNYFGIAIVPCHVEEDEIGFLPGDLDEKLDPNIRPIKNSLRNFIIKRDYGGNLKQSSKEQENGKTSLIKAIDNQVEVLWKNWFDVIPVAHARGRDFAYQIAFYDEFQDQSPRQADTLIKRQGEEGKVIIAGDIEQLHSPYLDKYNNGLVYASRLYFDNPRVAQVTLTADEVVRSGIVRDIVKRQADSASAKPQNTQRHSDR